MRRIPLPAPALPPGRPNLIVTGFMATGKTTAGRLAATELGLPFLDLDDLIEDRAGRPVAEIFATEGEEGFRARERLTLADAARLSGTVIATGGGAPLHGEFGSLAATGAVGVLTCEPEELRRRLGRGERPLATDPESALRLLAARGVAYAAAGPKIDATGRPPGAVARELAARWRTASSDHLGVEVEAPSLRYPVVLSAIERLGQLAREHLPDAGAAALVVDAAVEEIGVRAARVLEGSGIRTTLLRRPGGEAAKTLEAAGQLWERFLEAGLGRDDMVVAVGGGTTLDVAGFATATYMRGVALVTVPTTLLAMADAAVGGKAGVDHAGVKNLGGAFHHPRVVLADPSVADSLPVGERRNGLAEVVKAGVLASPAVPGLLAGAGDAWAVEQAVRIKAAYVGTDPADRGIRRSLNLGHTFGHAIESATGYAVPHGEAVAMGLMAAARLGASLGITDPALAAELRDTLGGLGLPFDPPPDLNASDVAKAMRGDKKRRRGMLVFVLPAPGGAELVEGVSPELAMEALAPERAGKPA